MKSNVLEKLDQKLKVCWTLDLTQSLTTLVIIAK